MSENTSFNPEQKKKEMEGFETKWKAFESLCSQLELKWFSAETIYSLTAGLNHGKAKSLTDLFVDIETVQEFLNEACEKKYIVTAEAQKGVKFLNNGKQGFKLAKTPKQDRTVLSTREDNLDSLIGGSSGPGFVFPESME